MKKTFYTEIAYIIGVITLSIGIALMVRADLGVSMITAPAYIIQLKLSNVALWFTLGMATYSFQFVLILILFIVLRKFNIKFFLSFITAFINGVVLDLVMLLISYIPDFGVVEDYLFYVFGMVFSSIGVSMFFHSYFAPEAYELFVKEISRKYKKDIHKTKTVYDICSLVLAVILSFSLFGFMHFEGIKWGTLVCALVNGFLIGFISKSLEKVFVYKDIFKFRSFFEQ